MISLKNYKQNLLVLFVYCALVPCSSNGASQQIQQPLHKACELGDEKEVQRLIQGGADVNAKDENGWPTLHHIARTPDNLQIVQLLIGSGADVNTKDKANYTALHVACDSNNSEIVERLIENGADVNAKTSVLLTALHFAGNKKTYNSLFNMVQKLMLSIVTAKRLLTALRV